MNTCSACRDARLLYAIPLVTCGDDHSHLADACSADTVTASTWLPVLRSPKLPSSGTQTWPVLHSFTVLSCCTHSMGHQTLRPGSMPSLYSTISSVLLLLVIHPVRTANSPVLCCCCYCRAQMLLQPSVTGVHIVLHHCSW